MTFLRSFFGWGLISRGYYDFPAGGLNFRVLLVIRLEVLLRILPPYRETNSAILIASLLSGVRNVDPQLGQWSLRVFRIDSGCGSVNSRLQSPQV